MATDITREEFIAALQSSIKEIERELDAMTLDRHNTVVVSTDFVYHVTEERHRYHSTCDCQVIGGKPDAVRLTANEAERISKEFWAENGHGRITWQTMGVRPYLERILEQNKRTLELINN